MFFVGIFGVEDKIKKIKEDIRVRCLGCGFEEATLVKVYSCFHIFFIPIMKWNEQYLIICNNCGKKYRVEKEDAYKAEEVGYIYDQKLIPIEQEEEDTFNIINGGRKQRCSFCGRELERDFRYCPYCGQKVEK